MKPFTRFTSCCFPLSRDASTNAAPAEMVGLTELAQGSRHVDPRPISQEARLGQMLPRVRQPQSRTTSSEIVPTASSPEPSVLTNIPDKNGNFAFTNPDSVNGHFCNDWLGAPFKIDSDGWPSVEHYLLARRFAGFGIDSLETQHVKRTIRRKIRNTDSVSEAKKLASKQKSNLAVSQEFWHVDEAIAMRKALKAKFKQHPQLKALLLATGTKLLRYQPAEQSINNADDAANQSSAQLLMELRDELRRSEPKAIVHSDLSEI